MPFHRPVTAVALLVSCDTLIRIKHTRVHIHTQATLALSHSRYVSFIMLAFIELSYIAKNNKVKIWEPE